MPPRFTFTAIFVSACSVTMSAQGQQLNVFDIYSGQFNFTTRSGMPGSSDGDLCALLPKDYYRCLGQQADSTTGRLVHRLNGIRAVVQDQDAGTIESLTFALVRDDPARTSFPDPDPLTEPIRSAPIVTPGGPPGAPLAWTLQIVFATPFDSVPTDTDLHLAVGLPGNPVWPADGLSVHMSGWGALPADAPFTGGTQPVPAFVHTVDRASAPAIVTAREGRVQRISMLTTASTLRLAADIGPAYRVSPNPNFGVAGLHPDHRHPRLDGVAFEVANANHPSTTYSLFASIGGLAGQPVRLGAIGSICLDPNQLAPAVVLAGILDGSGIDVRIRYPQPNNWIRGIGRVSFQAFLFTPAGALTNAASFLSQ